MREIRFSRRAKEITIIVGIALVVLLLYRTAHLLAPFIWALVVTYIFHPPVTFLNKHTRIPRAIIIIALYVVTFGGLTWTMIHLGPAIRDQTVALIRQVPDIFSGLESYVQSQPFLDNLGVNVNLSAFVKEIATRTNDLALLVPNTALPLVTSIVAKFINLTIFLVTTFYLLLKSDRDVEYFMRLIPNQYQHEIRDLLHRVNDSLGAYLRSQLILIVIMSTATFIFLSIIRLEYPLVVALSTGLLEIIPFIGPYTAGAIAVGVSLFQPNVPFGWNHITYAIVVVIGYFVLRQMEDGLVIPTLVGRVVHLNPIIVIFAVIAGAEIGGLLGILLAVPTASVVRILGHYFYRKVTTHEPSHIILLEANDDPIEKLAELASTETKQIVLLVKEANVMMQDQVTYEKLTALIREFDLEVHLISRDTITQGLAQANGIGLLSYTI